MNQNRPTFAVPNQVKEEPVKVNGIEEKLDSLHDLLKAQMTVKKEEKQEEAAPVLKTETKAANNNNFKFLQLIYNKLLDNEVDEKYANVIIDEIDSSLKKESNIDNILSAVYQKIILKLGEPEEISLKEDPTVVFFVGKTTTIAKIASKFKLNEKKKVAFISADTYRIAAVEQLNTYASIMDIPVKVIYSAEEMKGAIEEFKDFDLIIVDTAGRSHKDEIQIQDLYDLCEQTDKLSFKVNKEIMLVLSMTTIPVPDSPASHVRLGITVQHIAHQCVRHRQCIGLCVINIDPQIFIFRMQNLPLVICCFLQPFRQKFLLLVGKQFQVFLSSSIQRDV